MTISITFNNTTSYQFFVSTMAMGCAGVSFNPSMITSNGLTQSSFTTNGCHGAVSPMVISNGTFNYTNSWIPYTPTSITNGTYFITNAITGERILLQVGPASDGNPYHYMVNISIAS